MEVILFLKRKILSILLFSTLTLCALPFLSAKADALHNVITDAADVAGSDYTDSSALADKLDAIFEGEAGIYYDYSCTSLVDTPLGSSPVKNNGIYMYASPIDDAAVDIGTSCWIYAQGVYHTLFGESTDGIHSEELYLGGTGNRALTYDNLVTWGVRPMPGALIRASGHSMILLHYDADTITIVDGNGDGNGLVAVREYSWDYMGEYVEFIIQPESSYYADLYGWGMCGEEAFWTLDNRTLNITGSGDVLEAGWYEYRHNIENIVIRGKSLTFPNDLFQGCVNVKNILFLDAAPTISDNAFAGIGAIVRYPVTRAGWSENALRDYGGNLTWIPYGMTNLKITSQPRSISVPDGAVATVSVSAVGDGLSYHWYLKEPDANVYVKSAVSGPVYTTVMGEHSHGRQVICVITDQYGNFVTSQSAYLRMYDANRCSIRQVAPAADLPYFR